MSIPSPITELVKRVKKGTTKEKYSSQIRAFALTLQFYSNKAYNYVRKTFSCLPHPSTLRKWYQGIDGNPGFTAEAFKALEMRVQEAEQSGKNVLCSLIIDEIAIRQHIEWDKDKFTGYVDYGTKIESDSLPQAK